MTRETVEKGVRPLRGLTPFSVDSELKFGDNMNSPMKSLRFPLIFSVLFTVFSALPIHAAETELSSQAAQLALSNTSSSSRPLDSSSSDLQTDVVTVPQNPVSVEDISDRAYFDKVLGLITQSKESVWVSMYVSNPKSNGNHPVAKLFAALKDAARRGVKVRVWLNSLFNEETVLDRKKYDDIWGDLQSGGVELNWIASGKRLHDKLVIVDKEWVVEGSTNWTYTAIMKNFESATLIRSKELADKKMERLESFPVDKEQLLNGMQLSTVEMPLDLFTYSSLFPRMAEKNDRNAWDLYFYLLKNRKLKGPGPWEFELKDLAPAFEEGADKNTKKFGKRAEQTLKKLEGDYRLLTFSYGKNSKIYKITLIDPQLGRKKKSKEAPAILGSKPWSGTVRYPLAFFEYDYQKKWGIETQFVYGISLIMESESKTKPYWMSPMFKLEDRFHVGEEMLRGGLVELKKENVIEFIFPKKGSNQPALNARLLVSYKNNVLKSEEEKETELLKVKNLYGSLSSEEWDRARAYALLFDDPYDAVITRQFVDLIKKFPDSSLDPVISRVAQFSADNSLRSPDYIKKILEKK